jgi:hypothetical protein
LSVYEAQSLFRLARYLRSGSFPADRSELLVTAVQNHAPTPLLRQLTALPDGGCWRDLHEVARELASRPRLLALD